MNLDLRWPGPHLPPAHARQGRGHVVERVAVDLQHREAFYLYTVYVIVRLLL